MGEVQHLHVLGSYEKAQLLAQYLGLPVSIYSYH
jgi:hypothetical protein